TMKRSLLMTMLAPVLAAGSLNAAVFLELDGIKGETSGTNHAQAIEIESFSWGATNTAARGTGGAGGGKAEFSEFTVTKPICKAHPHLLRACTSPNPTPNAPLFVPKSATEPLDYYTTNPENVLGSSLNQISSGATTTAASTNSPPPSGTSHPTE